MNVVSKAGIALLFAFGAVTGARAEVVHGDGMTERQLAALAKTARKDALIEYRGETFGVEQVKSRWIAAQREDAERGRRAKSNRGAAAHTSSMKEEVARQEQAKVAKANREATVALERLDAATKAPDPASMRELQRLYAKYRTASSEEKIELNREARRIMQSNR